MAKYKTSSIGFDLSFEGPATVEDYNLKAGARVSGLPAVLEDAVGAEIAWGTLPEWQSAFADAISKQDGSFTREINVDATAKAKAAAKSDDAKAKAVVYETVSKSVKRYLAGKSDDDKALLAALAQEVADSISIDPSPSKRSGKIKGDLVAKADSILTLTDDEIEAKVEKLLSVVPNYELVREENGLPNRDSLARMIGAYSDAMLAGV
jgi:dihydroneopterin aldolase